MWYDYGQDIRRIRSCIDCEERRNFRICAETVWHNSGIFMGVNYRTVQYFDIKMENGMQ